jgi:hypothetical protein
MKKSYLYSHYKIIVTTMAFLITTACSTVETKPHTITSVDKQNTISRDEVSGRCQLPGQVRKLGSNFTYLTRGRIIQASLSTCKIRGGQMVAEI